jgi:hypothetical protein
MTVLELTSGTTKYEFDHLAVAKAVIIDRRKIDLQEFLNRKNRIYQTGHEWRQIDITLMPEYADMLATCKTIRAITTDIGLKLMRQDGTTIIDTDVRIDPNVSYKFISGYWSAKEPIQLRFYEVQE